MSDHDDMDELMAELIGIGFFNLEINDEGEMIYQISDDAQELHPEAYNVFMSGVTAELLQHVEAGYLEYRFNDELDIEYRLTPLGLEYMKSIGQIDPDFEPDYDE